MTLYAFKKQSEVAADELRVYYDVTPANFTPTRAYDGQVYCGLEFTDDASLLPDRMAELSANGWAVYDGTEKADEFLTSTDSEPDQYQYKP